MKEQLASVRRLVACAGLSKTSTISVRRTLGRAKPTATISKGSRF
jgi:hypothetical protein